MRRFGDPATYHRARPSYAPEAVSDAVARLKLDRSSGVLDLAAGTGKLTELLRPQVGQVIAVDPSAEMLAIASGRIPALDARLGSAEAIPVDEPVDAVFVGEAFHWFDLERAVPELLRVLPAGGGLALLFNRERWPQDPYPWLEGFGRLIQPALEDAGRHPRELAQWRSELVAGARFESLGTREHEHLHRVDADGFAELIGSWSFIAALAPAEREPVLARVRELVAPHGELALRYATQVELFRRV